ncbi:MAG: tRNA (adenosine(37)-N6)-threonylcarbamoyltransferase complex dimerization subunit type 1 TsaB [Candidatus Omnitrophica bacterium]|nr:tRNA (adenosine(37)-N6)-threonylcarbamoyltransferase complex dimerization subunit type 1 TsaB [Candidatus Omnitrophota bacterium]
MKILAFDTATKYLCIGIDDGERVFEYSVAVDRKLSALMAEAVRRTLDASGVSLESLDCVACGIGPGSFTALRIGLATAKGIGWALNKKMIGISTLDILALNAAPREGYVVPVMDAKRSLLYACVYKIKNKTLQKLTPYLLVSKDGLLSAIKRKIPSRSENPVVFLGDAVALYKNDLLTNVSGAELLDKDFWYPRPGNIIARAREMIAKKNFTDSLRLEPMYLYPKECQIHKKTV